jgi:hypothetical protein
MKNTVISIFNFLRSHPVLTAMLIGALWVGCVRVYYWLKPWLPYRIRLFMRQRVARRQRARNRETWPILESAGQKPSWFKGWPEGRRLAFVLTHDVELKKGLDRVRQLAEVEMALGFRSSFNFVPEGEYQVPDELRDWLVGNGFEVGIHDHRHDGKLYNSREDFVASAACINHFLDAWKACGFRSGFMLRKMDWIEDLNIRYDASTFDTDPFEPQPDGAGTIFPYWHPGATGRGYMELPYTLVQDSTLFLLLRESTDTIWREKLDWIAKHHGAALINVHPDYVCFDGATPEAGEFPVHLYAGFLKWVKETHGAHCWHTLPRDLAEHCRAQIFAADPSLSPAHLPAMPAPTQRPVPVR